MPLRQINMSPNPAKDQLVRNLVSEWQSPTSDSSAPTIIEENVPLSKTIHVYVVWDAWDWLTKTDRGEILMDAAELVKTSDEVMRITQAWGLTPAEADLAGLDWR